MNNGETDELLLKIRLSEMRDKGIPFYGTRVTSVGFGSQEYGRVPLGFTRYLGTEGGIRELATSMGITKSAARSKSDVHINGIGFSAKSSSAAPSALVNHTARPGFENACRYVGVDIHVWDKVVDEYWRLRLAQVIAEDIRNDDVRSPFRNRKEALAPVLKYFFFVGSGSGPSLYPSAYMLSYSSPLDESTWCVLEPQTVIDALWDRLVFSMRAKKGMPLHYNMDTYRGLHSGSLARWTRYCDEDYRGALHVRVRG